jgi:hypothetical protein
VSFLLACVPFCYPKFSHFSQEMVSPRGLQ